MFMKNKRPELYYDEKGNPKGYRVGISGDVYGTCPFCGKSYTEEDIKRGDVNFEHVFSRFAAKRAIGEKKVFSKMESEFMVAVHKDCNDRNANELEKHISRIINNFNKPDVSLTKQDALILFNYCIKTSVFLRYLFLWDDEAGQSVYENERLDMVSKYDFGKHFYENFNIRIRYVDASAGLWWNFDMPNDVGKYCFGGVFQDIEVSFFPLELSDKYHNETMFTEKDIFIIKLGNKPILLYGEEYATYPFCLDLVSRQRLLWKLQKAFLPRTGRYKNHIATLSTQFDDTFGVTKNYFIRQKKLSMMSQKRFEENKTFDPLDVGVVFCRNGQLYIISNDGILRNMVDLPDNTEIPGINFQNITLSHLPNISKLKVTDDIRIIGGNLESLDGCPQFVSGHVFIRGNKLTSLHGAPKQVGKSFHCDSNKLTSLEGAPSIINGDFSCENNKLLNLIGGPTEVIGDFICRQNQLTSLEGAPRKVGRNFWCKDNKIKSLRGAPEEIGGFFSFDAKNLESLDGLPKAKTYIPGEALKEFDSEDELRSWFKVYKKEQKVKEMQDGKKLVGTLDTVTHQNTGVGIPDDQYGM